MTKSERELMNVLWDSEEALTCAQIVAQSKDKKWKDSYVHIMVKSLLKQGLIEVTSFELVSKSYARKFSPTMTRDESIVRALVGENVWSKDMIPPMIAAFVEKEADLATLEKINDIINAKKAQIVGNKAP